MELQKWIGDESVEKIKTYNSITDKLGNIKEGLTRMYIRYDNIDANGNILGQQNSRILVATEPGFLFGIEESVAKQYKKLKIINGELFLKDGEVLKDSITEKTFDDGIYNEI